MPVPWAYLIDSIDHIHGPDTCIIDPVKIHPTPRIQLSVRPFVRSSVPIFDMHRTNMHRTLYIHMYDAIIITRPERPKGAKDEVKQARRATN